MYFFEDIYATCEACDGKRFKPDVLAIRYRGKTIHDVLQMTAEEALGFFSGSPKLTEKLHLLSSIGLGYLRLGQAATTLSGGEAQRLKIAAELKGTSAKNGLYIMDEPTTGLHVDDIKKLLAMLHKLVNSGNTVVVVEHNLDVIKSADWIIDLGPEGGEAGGQIVAEGRPAPSCRGLKTLVADTCIFHLISSVAPTRTDYENHETQLTQRCSVPGHENRHSKEIVARQPCAHRGAQLETVQDDWLCDRSHFEFQRETLRPALHVLSHTNHQRGQIRGGPVDEKQPAALFFPA
jgi:ABC-type multidrug transport system ATPase subunit